MKSTRRWQSARDCRWCVHVLDRGMASLFPVDESRSHVIVLGLHAGLLLTLCHAMASSSRHSPVRTGRRQDGLTVHLIHLPINTSKPRQQPPHIATPSAPGGRHARPVALALRRASGLKASARSVRLADRRKKPVMLTSAPVASGSEPGYIASGELLHRIERPMGRSSARLPGSGLQRSSKACA